MCNRYALRKPGWWKKYVHQHRFEEFADLKPRFNIAPTQKVLVIKRDEHCQNVPALARWGYVPSWTKGKPKYVQFNARDDKVLDSSLYKKSFDTRRCLVPADAFFEWVEYDDGKQPYMFTLPNDQPFAFAGFYDTWHDPNKDETADRMTFCTTSPNMLMKRFHDRMVCILRTQEQWDRWLDPKLSGEDVIDLLLDKPKELDVVPVGRGMNNSRHDGPVKPIEYKMPN